MERKIFENPLPSMEVTYQSALSTLAAALTQVDRQFQLALMDYQNFSFSPLLVLQYSLRFYIFNCVAILIPL